jgi:hypothetical protein
MIEDDFLPHEAVKKRPTKSLDAHGNDAYTYPDTGPKVRGWFQQRDTTETTGGRQTVATRWWFYSNDPDLQPRDRLAWRGEDFEVEGESKPEWSPDDFHHSKTAVRRVTG